jgi:glutamate--cysteine ligase
MSIPQSAGGPITSRADLVAHLAGGSKPRADWRIGTEHEKFVYGLKNYKPLPYEGPTGIRALLEGMERFGWSPIREGENIIGLSQDGAAISLEPGGQFELSGAPLRTIHETCVETNTHLRQVREISPRSEPGAWALVRPDLDARRSTRDAEGPLRIMRRYMPKVGGYGLEMMFRTCTVQGF